MAYRGKGAKAKSGALGRKKKKAKRGKGRKRIY